MRAALSLARSLVVGGFVFLLPIGVVAVVLGKLYALSHRLGEALQGAVMPGVRSDLIAASVAVVLLVAIALVAGVVAETRAGKRLFTTLERTVLARLPIYTILRQVIADVSGNVERLSEGRSLEVVTVAFDDHEALGFAVERLADGRVVVFLPGAPSALAGSVVVVGADRVVGTELKATEVMASMRRLGAGLAGLSPPRPAVAHPAGTAR